MERRYKLLAEAGVRNIDSYNRKVAGGQAVLEVESAVKIDQPELPIQFMPEEERLSAGETMLPDGSPGWFSPPPTPQEPLPYLVGWFEEWAAWMRRARR